MIGQIVEREAGDRIVGFAPDGETAKRMMEEFRPNVITLDLTMPGTGGLALLDYLRTRPHPPIVVVSSATSQGASATAEALDRGADACFDKACIVSDATRFVRVLKAAVRRKARRTLRGSGGLD